MLCHFIITMILTLPQVSSPHPPAVVHLFNFYTINTDMKF